MTCAYCSMPGSHPACCPAHPRTEMCSYCRAVPRPEWHHSPVEGRACCGRKNWSSTCDVCAKAVA